MIQKYTGIESSSNKSADPVSYPLDSYTSNLACAYSLRKLLTSYSGNCIQVKRSSDSTTQDIGFSSGVLDTSALTSFVGSGTGYVTVWYDQSGNGRNVNTVTSDATSPIIVTSGTLEVDANSKPRVRFYRTSSSAGARIWSSSTYNLDQFTTPGTAGVPNTTSLIFLGVDQATDEGTPFSIGKGSVNPRLLVHAPDAGTIYYDRGDFGTGRRISASLPGTFFTDTHNVLMLSQHFIRYNGSSIASGTGSGTATNNACRISIGANWGGGSNYNMHLHGYIQELAIWKVNLSSTDYQAIETEAINYYI